MAYWMLGIGARVFYVFFESSLEMVPVRLRRRDVKGGVERFNFLSIVLLLGKSAVEVESSIDPCLSIFAWFFL